MLKKHWLVSREGDCRQVQRCCRSLKRLAHAVKNPLMKTPTSAIAQPQKYPPRKLKIVHFEHIYLTTSVLESKHAVRNEPTYRDSEASTVMLLARLYRSGLQNMV